MIRRNRDVNRPNFNQSNPQCANRRASYLKMKLAHAFRVMAPALFALTFASVAHAQGTMDFSGAQTLMGTFNTRLAYVAISRASDDARIYTNNAETLGVRLASDISKTAAVDALEYVEEMSKRTPHAGEKSSMGTSATFKDNIHVELGI